MALSQQYQDEIDRLLAARQQQQQKFLEEYEQQTADAAYDADTQGWIGGSAQGASLGARYSGGNPYATGAGAAIGAASGLVSGTKARMKKRGDSGFLGGLKAFGDTLFDFSQLGKRSQQEKMMQSIPGLAQGYGQYQQAQGAQGHLANLEEQARTNQNKELDLWKQGEMGPALPPGYGTSNLERAAAAPSKPFVPGPLDKPYSTEWHGASQEFLEQMKKGRYGGGV